MTLLVGFKLLLTFSSGFEFQVSPVDFQLTQDQIHVLWESLANDPVCSDDFFQWLHIQVH